MKIPVSVLDALCNGKRGLFLISMFMLALAAILSGKLIYNFHSSSVEEAALKTGELAMYRELTARLAELEEEKIEKGRALMEAEKRLIKGNEADAAVAVLQEAFRACSIRSGISIASNRALPAVKTGSYVKVPMEFQFRADVVQLKELLSGMQASTVLMGMKGVKIKSRGASEPGRLDVSMVVESAMKHKPQGN